MDEVEVRVEEAALIRESLLFRNAWAVRRGEGTTMALMKLPGIDIGHFRLYQHWLKASEIDYAVLGYDKIIPDFANYLRPMPVRTPRPSVWELVKCSILADDLVHLWAIGNLLLDDRLQQTVLAELTKWYVDERVLSVVSKQTVAFVDRITQAKPTSPLRNFCVRWARCRFKINGELSQFGQAAPEWLLDALLTTQSKMTGTKMQRSRDGRRKKG